MATRRKTRSIAALEALYQEEEDQSATDNNASDTDDAENKEAGNSHASETDADEDEADEEAEESENARAAERIDAPPNKRGRPSYLRSKSGHKWSLSPPEQRGRRSQILHTPATKGNAMNAKTPIDAWSVLFSEQIVNIIIKHTNEEISRQIDLMKESNSKIDPLCHKHIDIVELNAIFGLLYYAGVHKMSKCKVMNLWSVHSLPLFKAAMQRNRFVFIVQCLRFDDKTTRAERKANDHFTHIREIWNLFIKNCIDNYEPGFNTTIDEQLLSFRDRCVFKMYIPSKPDKYDLKIISLNDAETHYMINAIPYCGTVTDRLEGEPIPIM